MADAGEMGGEDEGRGQWLALVLVVFDLTAYVHALSIHVTRYQFSGCIFFRRLSDRGFSQ